VEVPAAAADHTVRAHSKENIRQSALLPFRIYCVYEGKSKISPIKAVMSGKGWDATDLILFYYGKKLITIWSGL
jgi:hypothetical protein